MVFHNQVNDHPLAGPPSRSTRIKLIYDRKAGVTVEKKIYDHQRPEDRCRSEFQPRQGIAELRVQSRAQKMQVE